MSILDSITSELKADSTVTNQVSTRIYQDYAYAKAAKPYLVVYQISAVRFPHMVGASGVVNSRVQVDCVASTRASRDATGDAVRLALDMATGSIGKVAASNDQTIQYAQLNDDRHETVPPVQAGQRGIFTRSMDFLVWHAETVP